MNDQSRSEAKRFVLQHGPLGDLLETLATCATCEADRERNPKRHPAQAITYDEIAAILLETTRIYQLHERDGT